MNEKEHQEAISDIRQTLVRLDTKQEHIIQLLEDSRARADEAYRKANNAENTSKEALRISTEVQSRQENQQERENENRKFYVRTGVAVVGVVVTIVIFLTPIIVSYYTP
ncbi:hypothetical protein [Natribacillus halophilus]|uniref:Uncharacterized protein n=1 Tax=Natribacillus halophilus TaxID=549003 RepID=A0A1G8RRS5_9BACI|nr:hypothetical protein [Natribacillus halophilus]SDJ19666.1 hypothetical protein SAMN04488123_12010 [Natribacillus halophilus]